MEDPTPSSTTDLPSCLGSRDDGVIDTFMTSRGHPSTGRTFFHTSQVIKFSA